MKIYILIFTLLFSSSCVTAFDSNGLVQGILYTSINDRDFQTKIDNNVLAKKSGKACTKSLFGLFSWGDSSLETAKTNGQITKVAHIDRAIDIRFGYGQACTVVFGN